MPSGKCWNVFGNNHEQKHGGVPSEHLHIHQNLVRVANLTDRGLALGHVSLKSAMLCWVQTYKYF